MMKYCEKQELSESLDSRSYTRLQSLQAVNHSMALTVTASICALNLIMLSACRATDDNHDDVDLPVANDSAAAVNAPLSSSSSSDVDCEVCLVTVVWPHSTHMITSR